MYSVSKNDRLNHFNSQQISACLTASGYKQVKSQSVQYKVTDMNTAQHNEVQLLPKYPTYSLSGNTVLHNQAAGLTALSPEEQMLVTQ